MMKQDQPHVYRHRSRSIPERRSETRLLCSELTRVSWTGASGAVRDEIAILEDISPSGASLFLGVPVEAATPITLEAGGQRYRGTVRYCAPQPNGYLAGVDFEAAVAGGAAPGKAGYAPEHLLDVSRLDFIPEES